MSHKNIYLASDFHLGLDIPDASIHRERRIVAWLDEIKDDCSHLFLVGDVFDYWFEYSSTVPKGYTRLLGKLAEFCDDGIEVNLFTGNHDMWMFEYFQKEIGVNLYKSGIQQEFFGQNYYIAHGDGLGPGDHGYKVIKKIFSNPLCQFLFHRLHPNFGLWLMKSISRNGRLGEDRIQDIDNKEAEWLVQFARSYVKTHPHIDHFVFGHRHFAMSYPLAPEKATLHYLGDWLHFYTYLKIDASGPHLLNYPV